MRGGLMASPGSSFLSTIFLLLQLSSQTLTHRTTPRNIAAELGPLWAGLVPGPGTGVVLTVGVRAGRIVFSGSVGPYQALVIPLPLPKYFVLPLSPHCYILKAGYRILLR